MFSQNKKFIYFMYVCIVLLFLVNIIIINNSSHNVSLALAKQQQEQIPYDNNNKAIQDDIEVYRYKITSIDHNNYIGKSLDSNEGIYFTSDNINPGLKLKAGDTINAYFPAGDSETILNIEKAK